MALLAGACPGNAGPVYSAHSTTTVQKTAAAAHVSPVASVEQRTIKVGLNKQTSIELPDEAAEVAISDPSVVDVVVATNRRVHLLGRQTGQATASFTGHDGRRLLTLDVVVERDLVALETLIKRLFPNARVRLEAINDNIVLSGTVASPLDASRIADLAGRFAPKHEQVLNMLNVEAKEQVLLRVTVAEMNRTALQRLGVDIGDAFATKLLQNAFPITGALVSGGALGTGQVASAGANVLATIGNGNARMTALIQALERDGLARTLAEPNLTAISGETARFLAGGEYPVPQASEKDTTTIVFKPFGVSLDFTPVVLSDGRISLKIATEMSELTSDGAVTVNSISIPALKVRRASSTLELPSGGSIAMAGLLSRQTRRSAEGLPGLKQLPVLGELFRSDDFLRSETELVVIVTPVLVRSVPRGRLAEPGSEAEMRNAADGAWALSGPPQQTQLSHGSAGQTAADSDGDYGFIIE